MERYWFGFLVLRHSTEIAPNNDTNTICISTFAEFSVTVVDPH